MSQTSFARFLFRKDPGIRSSSIWILLASLALGIAALVALDLFSRRIESTIFRDSKSLLASDYQIQSWRAFDENVWKALETYKADGKLVQQSDFVSSLAFDNDERVTVSVRTLEGDAYPFYGEWISEPQLKISDLKEKPEIVLDQSFKTKGVSLGDTVRLGILKFKVRAFLIQEPQTVAGAFALGPRVVIHRKFGLESGLMGRGARVFNQLLIRSDDDEKIFKTKFRAVAPDPHWRLVTPEHANRQIERVITRLRGFLSFVALSGLFLGAVGLFMVFRSQFLARLQQFLTLRCLGARSTTLLLFALFQSIVISSLGAVVGVLVGIALEQGVKIFAATELAIEMAAVNYFPSVFLGIFISFLGSYVAVIIPMREVLKIPLSQAIRLEESSQMRITFREVLTLVGASILMIAFVARDLKLGLLFLGLFSVSCVALFLLAKFSSRLLKPMKFSFLFEQGKLLFLRKTSRSYLLVISIGLSLLFLQSILLIGASLKAQLEVASRAGIPNLFFIGLNLENLAEVEKIVPELQHVPMAQARIVELKGKAIVESELPEEGAERFYQTREYFITKRAELGVGERLIKGKSLFGEVKSNTIRVSLEERFASQMSLEIGDEFKIELAGVQLNAEVRSFRKVDWFNFQPNFFMVFQEDDLADAPMDFVGFARVDNALKQQKLNEVGKSEPQVTILDAESIAQRLKNILNQLSFSVYSVSLFSIGSCVFVFIGMTLARRMELVKEMALLRCLGLRSNKISWIYLFENSLTLVIGIFASFILSYVFAWVLCEQVLDIPLLVPNLVAPSIVFGIIFGFGNFALWFFVRRYRNTSYRALLESVEV